MEGEVQWADNCAYWWQDIANTSANTKKEDCGRTCLANPLCDHFTWDSSDGKCWLKKWSGSGPSVMNGFRCGFVKRQASSTVQQPTTTTQEPPRSPQSTIAATQRPSTGIGNIINELVY